MATTEYQKRYYQEHKEEYRERGRKWRAANRDKLRAKYAAYRNSPVRKATMRRRNAEKNRVLREYIHQLKAQPCADCGVSFPPECMDFDHVRGVKCFDVSKPNSLGKRFHEEIAKCDVVCSNCHRTRTHRRRLEKPIARGTPRG